TRKSSINPLRYGSGQADLPIQLFAVLPMLEGRSVIALFVATETPSTYSVPVYVVPVPSVTATWCQVPVDSRAGPVMTSSVMLLVVVIAKRTELGVVMFW